MRLVDVQVTRYRSTDDSTPVPVQDVTCLVGKNESGKTSFLQALYRLNPIESTVAFAVDLDYPRKDYTEYKTRHPTDPDTAVSATFELTPQEVEKIEADFGKGALTAANFRVSRKYDNQRYYVVPFDERAIVRSAITRLATADTIRDAALSHATTLSETLAVLESKDDPNLKTLAGALRTTFPHGVEKKLSTAIDTRLPKFVYFDDYHFMPGRTSLPGLKTRRDAKQLTEADRTVLRLMKKAGLSVDDFLKGMNYEKQVAELESAAIAITKEVFRFWSQNKSLSVKFEISGPMDVPGRPDLKDQPILQVRVMNHRHQMSVTFDERSRGFVWFFSFLAYFGELEVEAKAEKAELILLLDEPGLNLHGTAQADFLRFIEERLQPRHQVVYTTHSPFMVDPSRFDRVRTVQDMDDRGTVVSANVMHNDKDTLFPLQAAMGYTMTQTLFIGPNSLLVEGASEVLYFPAVSSELMHTKREGLDPRWTLTPINGVDKCPSFVSLFGANKLNLAVVMDYEPKRKKLLETLQADSRLNDGGVIPLHEIAKRNEADIEDLFEPSFYLEIVNKVYRQELPRALKLEDLKPGSERIVVRLEHYFQASNINKGKFEHARVADYFARNRREFGELNAGTLDRFETLFKKLNARLK